MDLEVMIWMILVGLCASHIHALAKCSFCRTALRRSKSKVLDMDFLMDFHFPMSAEQTEQIAPGIHPPFGGFDQVPAYLYNLTTEHPMMDGIINSERRVTPNDQSPIGKFIRTQAKDMERNFLSTIQIRKTRQTRQEPLNHIDRRKFQANFNDNRRQLHKLNKRFFVSRNLYHRPKSRRFKVDQFGNISWKPWHSIGRIVRMTKRDTGNRRLKLSDILTRAGFKKDKEEAIKVVLPLLLSDLKEAVFKSANPVAAPNTEQIQIPLISSPSGKQGKEMRNFKVKGDDGKEFSFCASASDVKQLMDILSKPNSSVVLERVSLLDKKGSLVKNDKNRSPGIIKTTNTNQKAKETANTPDGANTTESVLQLKEFENSVYESILQMDLPITQSKSSTTAASMDTSTAKCTEATTNSATTGS